MDLLWHALNSTLEAKTFYHTEKQGFGYLWLSRKFQTHPPKLAEAKPSFRKVSLPSAKLHMLFPAHLWVRESFGHKSTPSDRHWLRPTVQHSIQYKNGRGLECRKVNFLEYLGQGTLGCHSLSSLLFGSLVPRLCGKGEKRAWYLLFAHALN